MATRTERIEARIDPEMRDKIQQAAALTGTSTSAFIIDAAADRAERVLRRQRETIVSSEYFDELLKALDEPPKTIAALAKAAKRHRKIITRR